MEILPKIIEVFSSSAALLLSIVGLVVVFLTYLRRGRIKLGQFQLEFPAEKIIADGNIYISQTLSRSDIPKEPAERQYALMQQYHTQGLAQARISFFLA